MKTLGVIHARGGSKRIPRKNVKPLNGVPLLAYLVRAALATGLDRLIVSTDDDEIAAVGRVWGAEVPFKRPADISEDVPSEYVSLHALDWAEQEDGCVYDIVVTMQPTTPFIQPAHILECIQTVCDNPKVGACITGVKVSEPPQWMFEVAEDGLAKTFLEGAVSDERGVFQSLPPLYVPNGGAYATRATALREQKRLIADPTYFVCMDHIHSVDIDEPIDWIVAEAVAQEHGFKPIELKS